MTIFGSKHRQLKSCGIKKLSSKPKCRAPSTSMLKRRLLPMNQWRNARVDAFEQQGQVSKGDTSVNIVGLLEEGSGKIAHHLHKRKPSFLMQSSRNATPKWQRGSQPFSKAQKTHLFWNLKSAAWDQAHSLTRNRRTPSSSTSSNPNLSNPNTIEQEDSRDSSGPQSRIGWTTTDSTAKSPRRRVNGKASRWGKETKNIPGTQSLATPSWLQ